VIETAGLEIQEENSVEWQSAELQSVDIDLSVYTGTVRLRFSLEADAKISGKGWVLDDVVVQSGGDLPLDKRIFLPIVIKDQ
jgi:hypothetical protein